MTASSSRGRTATPRVKRCGSRISSRLENELEWPLCGCRRQEQPVLEASGEIAHRLGELAVHGVARGAGGRGVMRFVEHQHGLRPEAVQCVAQAANVGVVGEQRVRDDEVGARGPGIGTVTAIAAHRRQVLAVDDDERQTELGFEFVLPLPHHAGRRGDHGEIDTAAQQHLAQYQAGLDGFARTDIIRNQQVHARQAERLAQGEQLIGVEADTGAERCLEQIAIRSGGGAPVERFEIRGEDGGVVGAVTCHSLPVFVLQDRGVDFGAPDDLGGFALRIVIDACQTKRT